MDELEKKYLKYFGEDSQIPPRHIMETLVEMKENGSYGNKMEIMFQNYDSIKKRIENVTNEELTDKNIFFEIDFNKEK